MTERKPHPHLTPEARSAMLADYIAGVKLEAIAALYGVHLSYPGHYARKRGHPPRKPWCATIDRNRRDHVAQEAAS